MEFDATSHGCGWRVSGNSEVMRGKDVEAPPASPEVAEAALEKIRATLAVKRKAPDEAPEVKAMREVPMMEDVGHGTSCTCEVCWGSRMVKVFPDAKIVTAPRHERPETPRVSERLAQLQKMFPTDG